MKRRLIVGSLSLLALVGCNKIAQITGKGGEETAKNEPALVGAAPGPQGVKWEREARGALGSVEIPTGEDWKKEAGSVLELHNEKLDITILMQQQPGVPADARSEYLGSFIDVNKRDAPKYQVSGKSEGQVNQHSAGRVDGKFDNGTAYVTRDYVLFVKNAAFALMVRGPVERETDVRAIADHLASSYQ